MHLTIDVIYEGAAPPPAGSSVRVEARDTSRADARAITLATGTTTIAAATDGRRVARVELACERSTPSPTVWAHVDVDGDGRVSPGDWLTTQAYPVGPGASVALQVAVRKI